MANKGNRFLSILSIIVLFSIISVLYVVPSVVAYKNGSVVVSAVEQESKETEVPKKEVETKVETPVKEKEEEKKEDSEEELHISREWIIEGNHFVVDAYDGYGFISYPESVSSDLVSYVLEKISPILSEDFSEIRYAVTDSKVELTYNQGYTRAEVNYLLDCFENALSEWLNTPARPSVYIEEQLIVSDVFEINTTLDAMGIEIDVYATNGFASFKYPEAYISQSDVANALVQLATMAGGFDIVFDAALIDGETELFYSEDYTRSDVELALSFIQNYLDSIKPVVIEKEEIPEVRIPSKPSLTISSQEIVPEPMFEHIHRDFKVLGEDSYVDAYQEVATFTLPEAATEEMILPYLESVLVDYSSDLKGFDFALDGNRIEVRYTTLYTEAEMNALLDIAISYLSSIKPVVVEVEPEVVETVEPLHVSRVLSVLSIELNADAYDGYATVSYPENLVTENDVADALVLLSSQFEPYLAGFDFAISSGMLEITYPEGYTESDINFALDQLQLFLNSYQIKQVEEEVAEVKVPAKPEFIINHIHRDMNLLSSVVSVDAYDGYATIALPEFVTEEDVANALVSLYQTFGDSLDDFDFGLEGNVVYATYNTNYTEAEMNGILDLLESFLSSIKPVVIRVPSKPSITVSASLDPIHVEREMVMYGKKVMADLYDGYAVFSLPGNVKDDKVADAVVSLVVSNHPLFSDFDFAISENLEATYDEGRSYDEIENLSDVIESSFSTLKAPVPSKPSVTFESKLVEDVTHVSRMFDVYGVAVDANAYDGYATFEFGSDVDQNIVADYIVELYQNYPEAMSSFDFALTDNSVEATYPMGFSEAELDNYLDVIASSFDSKKN